MVPQLDLRRRRLLQAVGIGAAGLVGAGAVIGLTRASDGGSAALALRALSAERRWLNSAPLQAQDLVGKVLLINFWTYSCINSLRPLPYVREWARKYRDRGLIVIGAHAPEFAFEHDLDRVRRAVAAQGITYPVVLDNDYAIWSAFANDAWPAFYFVDAEGVVRHRMLGEGEYEVSEQTIQRLLSQARHTSVDDALATPEGEGVQAAPDWAHLRTPETYVGYAKAESFAGRRALTRDASAGYETPPNLTPNQWALSGPWNVGAEFATAEAGSGIVFRFHARDLNFVLGRAASRPIRFRVTLDGQAPGNDHGVDTDEEGLGVVDEDRLYQLVRQRRAVEDRAFAVTFEGGGARAYVFTFG
jgi:thiol-disulfide isomerase/thioredoxin